MEANNTRLRALRAAFPHTLPVLAGYLFLGLAYGVYARVSGFSFVYPLCMALTVYGGSLEFVAVSLLLGAFAPAQTLLMALIIQARHLFYGVAMLEKYRGTGLKKLYLIFAMSDETFAVASAAQVPAGVDKGWFYFFISLLDQCYWTAGAALGGLLGGLLSVEVKGIDFVMTAMFVVIFLDQWLKERSHLSSCIGVGASLACLLAFGADSFLIPAMACILALLTALRGPIERSGDAE